MQQSTADTVNDILKGVMSPGGFGQNLALDKPSAAKTGTIDNNAAVWFNGYTPELATAAMIAGANSLGQPITLNGQSVGGSYVASAAGSTLAGPMWAVAMRAVQDRLPATGFSTPQRGANAASTATGGTLVPGVTGLSVTEAVSRINAAGFYASVGERRGSSQPAGTVAETSPAAGAGAPQGTTVYVYPSAG